MSGKHTNKDRLNKLSAVDFWKEISALHSHPFREYIDYVAYLNSADSDITHFVNSLGFCYVKPSVAHMQEALNEGKDIDFDWFVENCKECILLKYEKMYGEEYAVVADLENMKIISVPRNKVVIKHNGE